MAPGFSATTTTKAQSLPAGSAARPAAKPVATADNSGPAATEASASGDSTMANPATFPGTTASKDGSTSTAEVDAVAEAGAGDALVGVRGPGRIVGAGAH